MSDKEYSIILECVYTNISEEAKIPSSFRISNFDSKNSIRMLVDKVHFNGQALLSRTVAIVSVEIQSALLELCNGPDEESPMAQVSVSYNAICQPVHSSLLYLVSFIISI